MGPSPPVGGAFSGANNCQIRRTKNRIAAKPRSHMWSTFRKENHQKLTFGEGVQPWDLARCPGRIESYRSMLELSIFMA